jgi:hypothetical protein
MVKVVGGCVYTNIQGPKNKTYTIMWEVQVETDFCFPSALQFHSECKDNNAWDHQKYENTWAMCPTVIHEQQIDYISVHASNFQQGLQITEVMSNWVHRRAKSRAE